jgi:hypothetical protein
VLPRDVGQFAERLQFGELRFVVGIESRPRPQAVAERKRDVVRFHDFANLFESRVEKRFLVMG